MSHWFLIVQSRLSRLNLKQRDRLSEFFANMAVASFAVTLLPQAIGIDKVTFNELILGLVIGTACLLESLSLIKDKHARK